MITIGRDGRPRLKGPARKSKPPTEPKRKPNRDRLPKPHAATIQPRSAGIPDLNHRMKKALEIAKKPMPAGWQTAAVSTCLFAFAEFGSSMEAAFALRKGVITDDAHHRKCLKAICARLRYENGLSLPMIGRIVDRTKVATMKLSRNGKPFLRPNHLLECKGANHA